MKDIDIYRSANLLIQLHGIDAPIQAAMKVDEMLAKGDLEGRDTWRRILKSIDALMPLMPDGEVH